MLKSKLLIAVTAAALVFGSPAGFAQTQPDPHHPAQGAGEVAAPSGQQAAGMDMMNMMAGMMKMMSGGQMGMGCMDMGGMGMTEHVEGRIAFLRAELQITDAQAKLWEAFADALRDNAKRL
ncbi:MAG: Spy/CpxP family protein refolding chaperone [Hyphomicrobiales bacterium]|nr:Spy/CpxP family protein refolding chaperone [Hyphomicrobiales bacterium]